MLARSATIFKWALYAGATLVFFFLQGALLQRISLWGVIPFVFPVLAAALGTCEAPLPASVYGLVLGAVCDCLLPGPLPCFYTLVFPAAALAASLIAQSLLPAGFACVAAASVLAFFLTDLFHCLVLALQGQAAWRAGAWVFLRETCLSLPLTVPAAALFAAVRRRTHADQ